VSVLLYILLASLIGAMLVVGAIGPTAFVLSWFERRGKNH
jgi:hypothetical protein